MGVLKRTQVLFSKSFARFTWMRCTWSRPWFPQRRRAWPALRAEEAWQQSGSLLRWWWTSCCSGPDEKPQQRSSRRCHSRKSSWWTWPCWRYQCRGGPASAPCRCRWSKTPSSSSSSSCLLHAGPLPWRRPSWLPWMQLWVACWWHGKRMRYRQSFSAFISAFMQISGERLSWAKPAVSRCSLSPLHQSASSFLKTHQWPCTVSKRKQLIGCQKRLSWGWGLY